MSFATTWIDLEVFRLSEVSERKTNIYHRCCLYVESNKRIQINLFSKQINSQTWKTSLGSPDREGRDKLGVWD